MQKVHFEQQTPACLGYNIRCTHSPLVQKKKSLNLFFPTAECNRCWKNLLYIKRMCLLHKWALLFACLTSVCVRLLILDSNYLLLCLRTPWAPIPSDSDGFTGNGRGGRRRCCSWCRQCSNIVNDDFKWDNYSTAIKWESAWKGEKGNGELTKKY